MQNIKKVGRPALPIEKAKKNLKVSLKKAHKNYVTKNNLKRLNLLIKPDIFNKIKEIKEKKQLNYNDLFAYFVELDGDK